MPALNGPDRSRTLIFAADFCAGWTGKCFTILCMNTS